MITLGELKTNITKLLCEYSKGGQLLTEDIPSVADRRLSMDFAIDVAMRKVMTVCGLECSRVCINAERGKGIKLPLPENFAASEALLTPSGAVFGGYSYVADSTFCFTPDEDGEYTLVYRHYPHSVAKKADEAELFLDAYIADAVAYGAAAELCDSKDGELFTRIKYRFDELMANRYNVDKLSAPPFNRVYTARKRKRHGI